MAGTVRKNWTDEAIVEAGLDPRDYEIVDGQLVPLHGPDILLRDVDLCGYEIVAGGRVSLHEMDMKGAIVRLRLAMILGGAVESLDLGVCADGARYLLREEEPKIVRVPDLSFVHKDRLPDPIPLIFPGAPDLAVEVLSPTDSEHAAGEKADQYLEFGAREVWVVHPRFEILTAFRPGVPTRAYSHGDTLATDVLPGFELEIDRLYPLP